MTDYYLSSSISGLNSHSDEALLRMILGSPALDSSLLRKVIEAVDDCTELGYVSGEPSRDEALRKTVESIGASLGKSDERSCLPRGKPDLETQLFAGAEFWRRRYRPATHRVKSARDLLPLLAPYKANSQEYFLGFYLNGAHELISQKVITIGLANSALVHPREVFSIAIRENACALVVAHNHPSGDLTPSEQDIEVTIRLSRAGDLMGIKLLDHIIVSKRGYFSFEEQGKLDDLKRSESSIRW